MVEVASQKNPKPEELSRVSFSAHIVDVKAVLWNVAKPLQRKHCLRYDLNLYKKFSAITSLNNRVIFAFQLLMG